MFMETHVRATEHHLTYGVTQRWMLPTLTLAFPVLCPIAAWQFSCRCCFLQASLQRIQKELKRYMTCVKGMLINCYGISFHYFSTVILLKYDEWQLSSSAVMLFVGWWEWHLVCKSSSNFVYVHFCTFVRRGLTWVTLETFCGWSEIVNVVVVVVALCEESCLNYLLPHRATYQWQADCFTPRHSNRCQLGEINFEILSFLIV